MSKFFLSNTRKKYLISLITFLLFGQIYVMHSDTAQHHHQENIFLLIPQLNLSITHGVLKSHTEHIFNWKNALNNNCHFLNDTSKHLYSLIKTKILFFFLKRHFSLLLLLVLAHANSLGFSFVCAVAGHKTIIAAPYYYIDRLMVLDNSFS